MTGGDLLTRQEVEEIAQEYGFAVLEWEASALGNATHGARFMDSDPMLSNPFDPSAPMLMPRTSFFLVRGLASVPAVREEAPPKLQHERTAVTAFSGTISSTVRIVDEPSETYASTLPLTWGQLV